MAVAFVGSSTNNSGTSSVSSSSVVLPVWTVGASDYILVAFAMATGANVVTTAPTGYTRLIMCQNSNGSTMYVYGKVAVGGDSGATVSAAWNATSRYGAVARVYSGVGAIDTMDMHASASATGYYPALTPLHPSGIAVGFLGGRGPNDGTTPAINAPAGYSNSAGTGSTAATGRNEVVGSADIAYSTTTVAQANTSNSTAASLTYCSAQIALSQNTFANSAPVANAGPNINAVVGFPTTLNGSASSDSDGTIIDYEWNFGDGTATSYNATASMSHTYATASIYTATLTVYDDRGTSASSTATVTVSANQAPIANAGTTQNVGPNATVTLDGSASYDPDNTTPLTYSWRQISGTATVTLSSTTAAQPTFVAPATVAGDTLTFGLTVTDGLGAASTESTVVINVAAGPFMYRRETGAWVRRKLYRRVGGVWVWP